MTSTLMWRPVDIRGFDLPSELKRTVSRRLWDTDGSCGGGEASMSAADISYLEGLRDAGVKGADKLIAAIEKHGTVILWHAH